MNYLGHFVLSHPDKDLLAGNFIADFVKGNQYKTYPEDIQRGILMHRFIDEFTDAHPASLQCKSLLRPVVGKLAGVALDILYDHVLAKDFSAYSEMTLPSFADLCYKTLTPYKKHMPLKGRYVFFYMKQHNWLCQYDSVKGIQTTLRNMSRRISFENQLTHSYAVFIENEKLWNYHFAGFFNDLQNALREKGYLK